MCWEVSVGSQSHCLGVEGDVSVPPTFNPTVIRVHCSGNKLKTKVALRLIAFDNVRSRANNSKIQPRSSSSGHARPPEFTTFSSGKVFSSSRLANREGGMRVRRVRQEECGKMAVGKQDQKIENPKIKANDVSRGEIYAPYGNDLYVCMSVYVCILKNVCCKGN